MHGLTELEWYQKKWMDWNRFHKKQN